MGSWRIEAIAETDLSPQAVFAIQADPATWPVWGHNAVWARSDGPLVEGGTVEVRANYGKVYRCRIDRFVPDRLIEFVARPPMMAVTQTYAVEPTPTGSRVRHALEISARFAGAMRFLGLPRVYRRQLEDEVRKVIELAAT